MFGECHCLCQALGARLRIKDIRVEIVCERANPKQFNSVEEAHGDMAAVIISTVERLSHENETRKVGKTAEYERRKSDLINRQRLERQSLAKRQEARRHEDARIRQARFRAGLKGLWDTLRGHNRKIRTFNEK